MAAAGGGGAVGELVHTGAGTADLEDADAVEADLLAHLEEVLHGTAEFVEDSLDV